MSQLSLTSWRNYQRAELSFEPGVTVLLGPNGQGKTNVVEAIGFLSTLSSHRVSQTAALILSQHDSAFVRATIRNGDREVRLELQVNRDRPNIAQISGNVVKPREVTRYCHSVIFAPEDLAIVRGDPSERRRFIDGLLVQLSPRFAGVMSDYERVVKQRSNLLKSSRSAASLSTLEVWNDKFVGLGSELIRERIRVSELLRAPLSAAYRDIVGDDHGPSFDWQMSWGGSVSEPIETRFREAIAEIAATERERGMTLIGPHRDDLLFQLNQLPVKGYASHGESWSFVLALRLAAASVLRQESVVGDPIVVLDDVFAELDHERRSRLARAVANFEQVLITAAVAEDVPAELNARIYRVKAGHISEPGVSE